MYQELKNKTIYIYKELDRYRVLKYVKNNFAYITWVVLRTILMLGLAFVLVYPLLYMLVMAFRPYAEITDPSVVWIPKRLTMENIKSAYEYMDYTASVLATVKTGLISTLIQTISCALVGYGFARYRFKGKSILFAILVFTIIVPPQTFIIPLYMEFRYFDYFGIGSLIGLFTGNQINSNILNTPWTFYLPAFLGTGIRSGLFIYIFRQFFRGMPKDLEDAACIDGCTPLNTFIKVMVPNAIPAFVTVILFSIVWYWNDYFYSSMFFSSLNTVSMALSKLSSLLISENRSYDPYLIITRMQAGSILVIAPVLVLYLLFQRYFTESIERTGIVG